MNCGYQGAHRLYESIDIAIGHRPALARLMHRYHILVAKGESASETLVGGSDEPQALPNPPTLGATGYPRVDSTQPQRCTFRPPSAAPFNRRSHTLWFVVLPSLGAHLPGPRKAENEPPRKMARPFD